MLWMDVFNVFVIRLFAVSIYKYLQQILYFRNRKTIVFCFYFMMK